MAFTFFREPHDRDKDKSEEELAKELRYHIARYNELMMILKDRDVVTKIIPYRPEDNSPIQVASIKRVKHSEEVF